MGFEDIKKDIHERLQLHDNIIIIENTDQLHIDKIKNGVVTIWVTWSPGFLNCINAIRHLHDKQYQGQIIVIDNDTVSIEFQIKTFGKRLLHGWGEIFFIKNGKVVKEFTGKESSIEFKSIFDKYADT
jgi:hypothetical protein